MPFLLNRLIVVDPHTGDTSRPARAEFPLDFDQRHTLTVIVRGKAPGQVGPEVLGVRPLAGLEGAMILRVQSGLPFSARGLDRLPRGTAQRPAAAGQPRAWICWCGGRSASAERRAASIWT